MSQTISRDALLKLSKTNSKADVTTEDLDLEDLDEQEVNEAPASQDEASSISQRKNKQPPPELERKKSSSSAPQPIKTARNDDQNREALFEIGIETAPAFMRPYLLKVQAVVNAFSRFLNVMGPYLEKAWDLGERFYNFIAPYCFDEVIYMIAGVIMMLFGGYFFTLIACVEAYRAAGWDTTKKNILVIWTTIRQFKQANADDDTEDLDHDGVADVNQISKEVLFARKIRLILRVVDPDAVTAALSGIYAGLVAVMATVKIQFARALALGVAIGDALTDPALRVVAPFLKRFLAPEYHKWVDMIIRYVCKAIGVSLAMKLQQFLSAFHSALRGAQMFTTYFALFTARKGFTTLSTGYWDEAFSTVLCGFGLYSQITNMMNPPFIVTLILFPLVAAEKVLQWLIVYDVTVTTTAGPAPSLANMPSVLSGAIGGAPGAS